MRGHDRDVHTERLIRHRATALNLLHECFWRWLSQGGEKAQSSGLGHWTDHFDRIPVARRHTTNVVAGASRTSAGGVPGATRLDRVPPQ